MSIQLPVSRSDDGLTVLEFLQVRIPAAPVGYLRQLLKKQKVCLRDTPCREGDVVQSDDLITLPESGRLLELLDTPLNREPEVDVLFESRELLVVNKPPGVALHAGLGHEADNLAARVASLLRERGDHFRVAPVHRLDLETSGPVLFGKGRQACRLRSGAARTATNTEMLLGAANFQTGRASLGKTIALHPVCV